MSLAAEIQQALHGESLNEPEPWLGWLCVCLCRLRARQTWLVEVSNTFLADCDTDHGEVPGLDGWSFDYHGRGLRLSGPGGEKLDYDFHDQQGATIDPYFFAYRALDLDPKATPETRLARWMPDPDIVVHGLHELRRRGIIHHPSSEHIFHLNPQLERVHEELSRVDFSAAEVRTHWARCLGDTELLGERAPELASSHERWLLPLGQDRRAAGQIIRAAARIVSKERAISTCERLLHGPIDSTTGNAVEALHDFADHNSPAVADLLNRLDPKEHHPYSAWAVARYLLARRVEWDRAVGVVVSFAAVRQVKGYFGNPFDHDLALLALEYAPGHALQLVRQALRSTTPLVVQNMAAVMVGLNQSWCHRELALALRETENQTTAPWLRTALRYLDSRIAAGPGNGLAAAASGREPVPLGDEDEEKAANLAESFRYAIEQLTPICERLRGTLPDKFDQLTVGSATP